MKGFSLISTVVYVALLAMLVAFSTSAAISMYKAFAHARENHSITTAASAVLEIMVREIRKGKSINEAESILGAHPGTLTINQEEGSVALDSTLFSPNVSVDSLIFYENSGIVTIRMTIGVKNFYSSAVMRGAYE